MWRACTCTRLPLMSNTTLFRGGHEVGTGILECVKLLSNAAVRIEVLQVHPQQSLKA